MKLLVSDYEVKMSSEDSNSEFLVKFAGPKDSPYQEVSAFGVIEPVCKPMTYREFGESGSFCRTNTPTNRLQLASLTEFSTPTSTRRKQLMRP